MYVPSLMTSTSTMSVLVLRVYFFAVAFFATGFFAAGLRVVAAFLFADFAVVVFSVLMVGFLFLSVIACFVTSRRHCTTLTVGALQVRAVFGVELAGGVRCVRCRVTRWWGFLPLPCG